jgi:hypothetical protein
VKNVCGRVSILVLISIIFTTAALAKTNTTTTLASSANPSTYASSVTFTATVSPSAATGTVTFKDGSTTLGTGTLSSGKATYTTSSLAAGSHSVTASYGGNTTYNGSTSSVLTQTVNKANSTTTLSSSANPSTYGSSVKFTATVSPSSCTGTVTFKDSSTTLGTGSLSSGKATYTTSTLAAGSHSITGSYAGDSNCNASTSSTLTQTVNKANTTTSISSSSNPSAYGSSVIFTATISSTTATGTITFKDGTTTLGTGNVSNGTATYATSSLTVGSHSITGVYSGDSNYNTSTSSKLTQTVKQGSSVTVSSSTNPAPSGSPVTFTAVVSPSAATGTVTFYDSSTSLGSGTLSGAVAPLTTSSLATGSHSITAVYGGDATYVGSTSPVLTQSVKTLSSISLSPMNVSVPVGATQQFTATGTFSDATVGNITASATWSSSDTTVATVSGSGVATLLDEGPTTIQAAIGSVNSSTTLTGTPSRFRLTGSLNIARDSHTATLLQDGKVLIVGGNVWGGGFAGTAELYDPNSGTFSKTGNLLTPCAYHTATLLNNGKVLIVGGDASDGFGGIIQLASAELYDPNSGTFSFTGSLNVGRTYHSATLLNNGMVLVTGGRNVANGELTDSELYDPSAGTFSTTGALNTARDSHTATLLNDGTVLIAGGEVYQSNTGLYVPTANAEIYNPSTGTFTATGNLNAASSAHSATLLNSGKVLIAGGWGGGSGAGGLSRTELYDPVARTFALSTSLSSPRQLFASTILSTGQVLLVGGYDNNNHLIVPADLYDPASATVSIAGNLNNARLSHTVTSFGNGLVLIAGGSDQNGYDLTSAETYQSSATEPPPPSLQITPGVANIAIGGTQQFTAVDNLGYPRLDVTWTVSDPTIATVSTDEDNAAIVTGVAAGQVTLTANAEGVTSQQQVTILSQGAFTPGMTIWSAPPPAGYSVQQVAQAVPSTNGPDLFSISTSADGTQSVIQALKSDGEQLSQTTVPAAQKGAVPDGFGGLIVTSCPANSPMTVTDLDATGQPKWQIQSALVQGFGYICVPPRFAVAGDGTAYVAEPTNAGLNSMTIASPSGYTNGFSFPPSTVTKYGQTTNVLCCVGPPMVNTDGTGYVEYEVRNTVNDVITSSTLYLWISTSGSIVLSSTTQDQALLPGSIIPDGNGGILATWAVSPSHSVLPFPYQAADVTGFTVGTPYSLPFSPQSVTPFVTPTLVLGQNGTVFAAGSTTIPNNGGFLPVDQIASFNISSGATNWTYQAVPPSTFSLLAALDNGGVAISDSQNGIVQLTSAGAASPVTGPAVGSTQYSWRGTWYSQGSQASSVSVPLVVDASNVWAGPNGNPSINSGTGSLCNCEAQVPPSGSLAPQPESQSEVSNLTPLSPPPDCPICALQPPTPPQQPTSCLTIAGTGPTNLMLIGDSGIHHFVGFAFALAAQQKANDLQVQSANKIIACRVSTIEDVNAALTLNGVIGGDVHYFGHSGLVGYTNTNGQITAYASMLFVGQGQGADANIAYYNYTQLCSASSGCNINSYLSSNTAIRINGCQAAQTVLDAYANTYTSIAQLLSNQLNRGVYAYDVGMYFSSKTAANDPYFNGEGRLAPSDLPVYMVPAGAPGNKPGPKACRPFAGCS